MHVSKRKGYIPRITASRHLIGRASLVISLARSISLLDSTSRRDRGGELKGFALGRAGEFSRWAAYMQGRLQGEGKAVKADGRGENSLGINKIQTQYFGIPLQYCCCGVSPH